MRVQHGDSVEARPGFVVEGVWDAAFEEGGFHASPHFFGSGLRVEGEALWMVPSRALVDRLVYCEEGDALLASNSLALLLGCTGARLAPRHDYRRQSFTILRGIDHYDPSFPVTHPRITELRQRFHHPLAATRAALEQRPGPAARPFASFADYHDAVEGTLTRIRENAASPARHAPLRAFSTISAGYDSGAVTALVRDGIEGAFTSRRSNSTIRPWMSRKAAIDDGTPIARRLGVETLYLDRHPDRVTEDELFFLAPTAAEPELVFHSMARHIEQGGAAVVFTGFHGDKVWDVDTSGAYLSDQVRRGDVSGLNLSEIRLKAGFVNVAVPFLFARQVQEIVAVSRSDEMLPWRLHNGYDRPIPRRILEESGVPRHLFGQRKKAVVQTYGYPVHPTLRRAFLEHLRARRGIPTFVPYLHTRVNRAAFLAGAAFERLTRLYRRRPRHTPTRIFWKGLDLPYELHAWALEALADRLAPAVAPFTSAAAPGAAPRAVPAADPAPASA
ncbi:MAG TPA: hypothetical protein VFR81_10115 [Longimicrobium sp.]|nr:hypothetical protein [Longimicrobium sp.]